VSSGGRKRSPLSRYSATVVVSVRLTPAEASMLDASGLDRGSAIRALLARADWSGSAFTGQTLPVLWARLIADIDAHVRRFPVLRSRVEAAVVPLVEQEEYPAALAAWRRLLAEHAEDAAPTAMQPIDWSGRRRS
jgi:hypothetical protein